MDTEDNAVAEEERRLAEAQALSAPTVDPAVPNPSTPEVHRPLSPELEAFVHEMVHYYGVDESKFTGPTPEAVYLKVLERFKEQLMINFWELKGRLPGFNNKFEEFLVTNDTSEYNTVCIYYTFLTKFPEYCARIRVVLPDTVSNMITLITANMVTHFSTLFGNSLILYDGLVSAMDYAGAVEQAKLTERQAAEIVDNVTNIARLNQRLCFGT